MENLSRAIQSSHWGWESWNDQRAKEKEDSNVSTSFQSFCQQEMLPAALRSQEVSRAIASIQKQVMALVGYVISDTEHHTLKAAHLI